MCETDFTNHYCDGCGSENPLYHMLGSSESIDYCRSCYSKSPAELCRPNRHEGTCDVCYQSMNPGQGYEFGNGGMCCDLCQPRLHSIFASHTDTGLIKTERDYLYIFDDNIKLDIPSVLSDRMLSPDALSDDIDSIVRPPMANSNLAEWRMFTPYTDVPSFCALCAWAVRCVNLRPDLPTGKYEIASMLCDNHGRIAMNIIGLELTEFLAAEEEWDKTRPSEEQRQEYLTQVSESFAKTHSCDDDLMASAADSFAVYYRLKHRLPLYYG